VITMDVLLKTASNRPRWRSHTEFFLTMVGYAVGLGNIWRFPYLCYENGGAVFLVPYLTVLVFLGIPVFCLELASGQLFNKNNIYIWPTICPHMSGVGLSSLATTFLVCIYYNVILAWALLYWGASFISPLPWTEEYNSMGNLTMDSTIYFEENVLHLSDNISELGYVPWKLALCLTVAWIMVFLIIFKGIESSGRVVYFTATFPYLVLTIMVIRGVTLPGAIEGLKFYLIPDFTKLGTLKVWVKAGEQVFFSLGIGWGTHVTFASYNHKNHNFLYDVYWVPIINAFTSFFAGFSVFGTLGYLSHVNKIPISELAAGGFGLAFEVYPSALAQMVAPNFFNFLFFFMLILLAIDSQFAFTETIVSAIIEADLYINEVSKQNMINQGSNINNDSEGEKNEKDQNDLKMKNIEKRKLIITISVCIICWILGFFCICQGGLYFVQILDGHSVGFTLFAISGCELFSISYVFGVDRFIYDCQQMIGMEVSNEYMKSFQYFRVCWKFISPFICFLLVIAVMFSMFGNYDKETVCYDVESSQCTDEKVNWGIDLGNSLAIVSFSFIPFGALLQFWRSNHFNWEKWMSTKHQNEMNKNESEQRPTDDLELVEIK